MTHQRTKKYTIMNKGVKRTLVVPIYYSRQEGKENFIDSLAKENNIMLIIAGLFFATAIMIFLVLIATLPDGPDSIREEITKYESEHIIGDDRPAQENPWEKEIAEALEEAKTTSYVIEETVTQVCYSSKVSNTNTMNGDNWVYNASEKEVTAMACVIHNEARGENFEGKVAVGATLINRHFSDNKLYSGKTLIELATQSSQYSYSEVPMKELEESGCLEAAYAALRGEDPTRKEFPTTGALFFYNPEYCTEEALATRTGVHEQIIGNHHFHVSFS